MPLVYKVQQGDDGWSVAARFGFTSFDDIAGHPANAELKKKRPNPAALYPGDEIHIPDRVIKEVAVKEKKLNKFKIHLPRRKLELTLNDQGGHALAGVPYTLVVGDERLEGETDAGGTIQAELPATASSGTLVLAGGIERVLMFGYLNPMRDAPDGGASGVAWRLHNLGFYHGSIDGTDEEPLTRAIVEFQESRHLTATGAISGELIDALEKEQGI